MGIGNKLGGGLKSLSGSIGKMGKIGGIKGGGFESLVEGAHQVWSGQNAFERSYPKLTPNATPDQIADYLIGKRASFVPTKDIPSPSRISGADEIENLAAVVAGSKPAVLAFRDYKKEITEALTKRALAKGLEIKPVPHSINQIPVPEIIVGNKEAVEGIHKLLTEYLDKPQDENFHRRLGNLLGYPDEAVEDFLNKYKR